VYVKPRKLKWRREDVGAMGGSILKGFEAACVFLLLFGATWYWSSRRKAFIRTFCPPNELRVALRSLPRDEDSFRRAFRFIALLQLAAALALVIVTTAVWALR
jgi:hypothetical protein